MGKAKKKKRKKKPGPKEQRLKVTVSFTEAIKASFAKKKPKGGWPELATE
jgi:hypothetical protein